MITIRHLTCLLFSFVFLSCTFFSGTVLSNTSAGKIASHENLFPRADSLKSAVNFWTKVYTEISTSEGYIHDNLNLSIIYEKIKIPNHLNRKARSLYNKKVKSKYKKILNSLAEGKRTGLSAEEKRVLRLWPKNVSNKELARAKNRLRFQLGQSDKFKAGLIRSGSWKPYINKVLRDMGLPLEISALPHVESSFNYKAYSKVGAAGMWQFTRSTGRRYMRVDHVLDERLDPFISTIAAARLLKNNLSVTGTWPLALTAYNHGAAGMRRATKKVGSKDISLIIKKYKSRSFGFASRNFYPSFLAASDIDRAPEKYFKNIKLNPPVDYEFVKLPAYLSVNSVLKVLNMDRSDFINLNPALRPAVLNENKYIPKSYELRIDSKLLSNVLNLDKLLAGIDPKLHYKEQKPDRFHRVRKGQNLSIIAARYGLRLKDLVAVNHMRNKHQIRVGQVLILPHKKNIQKAQIQEQLPPKLEPIALPENGIYTVKRGDSLDLIARRNAVDVKELLKLNQIRNKNKIFPGQKLLLVKQEINSSSNTVQIAQLVGNEQPSITEDINTIVENSEAGALKLGNIKIENDSSDTNIVQNAEGKIEDVDLETGNEDAIVEENLMALLADPNDYSVSEKNTIEIQAAETLGHYAEWLQIRASDIRRLNRMRYGRALVAGKRLKLQFTKVTPEAFEVQRIAYHKTLQEEFFEQNQIIGSDKYHLGRGQSVWKLTHNTYKIPFWLLRQYNPDLDMNRIAPGKLITFPKVQPRGNHPT